MKDKLISILLNPFLIAIVISFAIIYSLPDFFRKYSIEIVSEGLLGKNYKLFSFCDLNNNGISEKIGFKDNITGNAAVKVILDNRIIIDQWNLYGKFPHNNFEPCYHDLNNDGFKEIIIITQKEDSAFINIIEPLNKNGIQLKRFICTINKQNNNVDFSSSKIHVADLDLDGSEEIIFSINAGFSISPRKIFVLDLLKDTIYSSKHVGNKSDISHVTDITGDGYPEILLATNSAGNFSDTSISQFDDYSSWVIILDKKLEFIFKPIEFPSSFSSIYLIPIINSKYSKIAVLLNTREKSIIPDKLMLINSSGYTEKTMDLDAGSYCLYLVSSDNSESNQIILYNCKSGLFELLSLNFEIIGSYDGLANSKLIIEDLGSDKNAEFIFNSNNSSLTTVFNTETKKMIEFELTNTTNGLLHTSIIVDSTTSKRLFIQKDNRWFTIKYFKNPLFWLKIPFFFGIFTVILFLEYLIIKGQKIKDKRERVIKNQIIELQIKTIKNQVDPHFVFNAINTISEMMLMDNKIEADKFICNFSDLMRKTLKNSDKITCSLQDELDYNETFIQLQKIRYDNCFDYIIETDKNLNLQFEIPKHVLFTYVENAIKHGLSLKKKNGLLKICVVNKNNQLILSIEDNGNGLEKSKTSKPTSTGNGLLIMEKIYNLYAKIHKKKITHKLIELFDNKNKPVGIKVEIKISL